MAAPFFLPSGELGAGQDSSAEPFSAAASLRMADPRAQAPSNLDANAESAGASEAATQQKAGSQVVRRKGTDLQPRLWHEEPLLRRLADGRCDGDFAAATSWLQEASAVRIESAILAIPAEEPFEEVRMAVTDCVLWESATGADCDGPCAEKFVLFQW